MILAFFTFIFGKLHEFHFDLLTKAWHELLFGLLVATLSIDLVIELLRSTASGIRGARLRFEPIWPALADVGRALRELVGVFLPPRFRRPPCTPEPPASAE